MNQREKGERSSGKMGRFTTSGAPKHGANPMDLHPRHDDQLALIMSSLGDWLAGCVARLQTTPNWAEKPPLRQSGALKDMVCIERSKLTPEDDQRLATFFHHCDGTWEALMAEIIRHYPALKNAERP